MARLVLKNIAKYSIDLWNLVQIMKLKNINRKTKPENHNVYAAKNEGADQQMLRRNTIRVEQASV